MAIMSATMITKGVTKVGILKITSMMKESGKISNGLEKWMRNHKRDINMKLSIISEEDY
jgi:hypothetical protein